MKSIFKGSGEYKVLKTSHFDLQWNGYFVFMNFLLGTTVSSSSSLGMKEIKLVKFLLVQVSTRYWKGSLFTTLLSSPLNCYSTITESQ